VKTILRLLLFAALCVPARLYAQAEEQLRQAIRRYENLEIEQARVLFQQVISPSSPFPVTETQRVTAYKYLGATLASLGQRDSAITFFVAAIQRDPLVDLDPRSFSEQERLVFSQAKRRVFRVGVRPLTRDTIDPRTDRRNITIATTHLGQVHVELASTDTEARIVLFDGDVDGARDIPFNGLVPGLGGFIPPGIYELFVIAQSRTIASGRDSAGVLIEIQHQVAPLEDTLATLAASQLLQERYPSSAATRSLLVGTGVAVGALLVGNVIASSTLEASTAYAGGVALAGLAGGLYAFMYRRQHPEIPANMAENQRRRAARAQRNQEIMQRNTERIAATRIVVRPLGS
jgi:tetratricopeptide (TPR) repeat protein